MVGLARYIIQGVMGALVIGGLLLAHYLPRSFEHHTTLGAVDGWIIFFCSVLVLLSIWGMISVGLSEVKRRVQTLAKQEAIIPLDRWDYRFIRWVNFGEEPSGIRSECEHWALVLNSVYGLPVIRIFVAFIYIIVGVFGWFFGGRPDFANAIKRADGEKLFRKGGQLIGPLVLLLIIISGVSSVLTLSGTGSAVGHGFINAPWLGIGKWVGKWVVGVAVFGTIVAVATFYVIAVVVGDMVRAAQPFFSWAILQLAGVCRPVRYVRSYD